MDGEDNFPRKEENEKYKNNDDDDKWGDALEKHEGDDYLMIMSQKEQMTKEQTSEDQV